MALADLEALRRVAPPPLERALRERDFKLRRLHPRAAVVAAGELAAAGRIRARLVRQERWN